MKKDEFLFKVFKATTNAEGDVWKESQLKWHPNINKRMIGKKKIRYTVPIALLGKTKSNKQIMLMVQTSTAKLNFNHFIIEADKFTKTLEAKIQYIYIFNVRIGLEDELVKNSCGKLLTYGEIVKVAQSELLEKSYELIKNTKRSTVIQAILNGKYGSLNDLMWKSLIKENQFSRTENDFRKGIKKAK